MQFTNPKTKEQMYTTLQEIFYYYRIRRESWESVELQPLQLKRLQYKKSTEQEISERAEKLVSPDVKLKKYQSIQELTLARSELASKMVSLNQQIQDIEEGIVSLYDKQVEEIKERISRLGTTNSTIEASEINKARNKQNEEIARAMQEHGEKIAVIQGEIQSIESKILEAETFYNNLLEEEILKKIEELKAEEDKRFEEVEKYNNSIDEKELRHSNDVLVKQANLELKYKELNQAFFSKDQLIEMGYYKDVMTCVCAYYNTLDALKAYQDLMAESKVVIYLEDYYSDIVYMYRSKAGL